MFRVNGLGLRVWGVLRRGSILVRAQALARQLPVSWEWRPSFVCWALKEP